MCRLSFHYRTCIFSPHPLAPVPFLTVGAGKFDNSAPVAPVSTTLAAWLWPVTRAPSMRRVTAGGTWTFSFSAMARKQYSLSFRSKSVGMVHGVVKVISAVNSSNGDSSDQTISCQSFSDQCTCSRANFGRWVRCFSVSFGVRFSLNGRMPGLLRKWRWTII